MNKKLAVFLLAVFVLLLLAGTGFFFWKYKNKSVVPPSVILEGNQVPSEQLEKQNVESAPTKDLILNGDYNPGSGFSSKSKVQYKDGHADLPVQYPEDSSESNIDKNFITFADLDNDGVLEAIFITKDEYYNVGGNSGQDRTILNIAQKNQNGLSIIASKTIEYTLVGEGMSFVAIKSLSLDKNIISLDLERDTGCQNLPSINTIQKYEFKEGKLTRLDQPENPQEISMKFISPKAGDIWKIGEPHTIILDTPWPYAENCNNTIEIDGGTRKYADLSSADGRLIIPKKGGSEYPWDGKNIIPLFDEPKVISITPGSYTLRLESYVSDDGSDVTIYSEPFTITN